jgi:hypothetical protein
MNGAGQTHQPCKDKQNLAECDHAATIHRISAYRDIETKSAHTKFLGDEAGEGRAVGSQISIARGQSRLEVTGADRDSGQNNFTASFQVFGTQSQDHQLECAGVNRSAADRDPIF